MFPKSESRYFWEVLKEFNIQRKPWDACCANGYLDQQVCKLHADLYVNHPLTLYIDSDVFFHRPVHVSELMEENKPRILFTDYNLVGDAICWKQPTEAMLGHAVGYEFMRRLPMLYWTESISQFRNWFQTKVHPDMKKYIGDSGRFSEFNALGAWCNEFEPHKYTFKNTDHGVPEAFLTQGWSWGGLNVEKVKWMEEILK